MPKTELDTLHEQIHQALQNPESLDAKGKELLRHLAAEINASLDDKPVEESLVQALEESISHLEVEHPHLTRALSHFLTSLSNAGI